MAVSITSNMTTIATAEAADIANWGSSSNKTGTDANAREGVQAFAAQAQQNTLITGYYEYTTGQNWTGITIFAPWIRPSGVGTFAQGGFSVYLAEGNNGQNEVAYHVGGVTNYGSTARGWSRFRLDTAQLSNFTTGEYTEISGTKAGLEADLGTDMRRMGAAVYNTSAPSGQAFNVYWDVIRTVTNGTPALDIKGGTTGDRGNFGEIVTEDESTTNAWGVIFSKVDGGKVYELLYGIEIGDDTTLDSYFEDSDFQLFVNGTDMTAGNMDITVVANSTGTNLFSFDNFSIVGVGTVANWDLSNTNLDTMSLTNGSFTDCGTIDLPPSGGTLRQVDTVTFNNVGITTIDGTDLDTCTFNLSGQIVATGVGDLNSCVINESTATSAVSTTSLTKLNGCTFVSDGTGHAVDLGTVAATTSMTWNCIDSNYAATNGSTGNETILVNVASGQTLTINVSAGASTPTYYNTGTGTVNVVSGQVTLTLTGIVADSAANIAGGAESSEVRIYSHGTTTELDGIEDVVEDSPGTKIGSFDYTYTYSAGTYVDIVVHHIDYQYYRIENVLLGSGDASIPIQQIHDRNYNNPV